MISVNIKYYMGIENLAGAGHEIFSFQGSTVGELIEQLINKHPSLKTCFVTEREIEPVPGLSVLVNGKEIMWLQKMSTPLSEGDEVTFLRFVSGG